MTAGANALLGDAAWNLVLLSELPPEAKCIVELEESDSAIQSFLEEQVAGRRIHNLGRSADADHCGLPGIFDLGPPLAKPLMSKTVDVLLYKERLSRLDDPVSELRRHRSWLGPAGFMLCFTADPITTTTDGAKRSQISAYATTVKMLMDGGYAPELMLDLAVPEPILLESQPQQQPLESHHLVLRGRPVDYLGNRTTAEHDRPLTFVVCVSKEAVLQTNLLSSPCLRESSPHQILLMPNCSSAAEGLNRGLDLARNDLVVCVHQDVYLPDGWTHRLWQQFDLVGSWGNVAVMGVYGMGRQEERASRMGSVVDRNRLLREPAPVPAVADTLDELLLVVRKSSGLRFDPRLGFHFYGADICLAAQQQGLLAVAIDALCYHNSSCAFEVSPEFLVSGRVFAEKWADRLPVITSCVQVDQHWLPQTV